MSDRAFRFGIVNATAGSGEEWVATARHAEGLGFDTVLVPDTTYTLSPFAALAAVAATTTGLRVGTYVLSIPNRSPGMVAWETETLQLISGGRFELGLGGGRQGADRDAETLGATFGTAAERINRVREVIRAVRTSKTPPPILIAASKPRMLRVAAEEADIVALGVPPYAPESDLAAAVATLRDAAGDRFDQLELQTNLVAVAETPADIPDFVSQMVGGGDPRQLAADGGNAFMLGTPRQIADTLLRRRDTLGASYIAINAAFTDKLAPVIDLLRDR